MNLGHFFFIPTGTSKEVHPLLMNCFYPFPNNEGAF